jgi:hypothetical protein
VCKSSILIIILSAWTDRFFFRRRPVGEGTLGPHSWHLSAVSIRNRVIQGWSASLALLSHVRVATHRRVSCANALRLHLNTNSCDGIIIHAFLVVIVLRMRGRVIFAHALHHNFDYDSTTSRALGPNSLRMLPLSLTLRFGYQPRVVIASIYANLADSKDFW